MCVFVCVKGCSGLPCAQHNIIGHARAESIQTYPHTHTLPRLGGVLCCACVCHLLAGHCECCA